MFKKIGIVTALSSALLFGGAFQTSVDAAANTDHNQTTPCKVYYSINGGNWTSFSQDRFNDLLNRYFPDVQFNWDNSKKQPKQHAKQADDQPAQQQAEQADDQPAQQHAKQADDQPAQQQAEQADDQSAQQQAEEKTPAQNSKVETQQPTKQQQQTQQANKQEQQKTSEGYQLSQYEKQVVELTNKERTSRGLEPLKVDKELSKVAREKSRDMQENNYFSHNSPTYGSPFDMMKSFGISYRTAGENIARGQRTPEEVVNAWMNSEGHRANILNPDFTHIGVGYVADGNYWTQQFIGK